MAERRLVPTHIVGYVHPRPCQDQLAATTVIDTKSATDIALAIAEELFRRHLSEQRPVFAPRRLDHERLQPHHDLPRPA